jgi:hypothetical protein
VILANQSPKSGPARNSQENSNASDVKGKKYYTRYGSELSDIGTKEKMNADDTDQTVFIRVHVWLTF